MNHDELFLHVRIAFAIATIETQLGVLTENAALIDPGLAARIVEAFGKYSDARRALIPTLSIPMPESSARN
jgi:hypothetical protein